jgi:hypothetical protein
VTIEVGDLIDLLEFISRGMEQRLKSNLERGLYSSCRSTRHAINTALLAIEVMTAVTLSLREGLRVLGYMPINAIRHY